MDKGKVSGRKTRNACGLDGGAYRSAVDVLIGDEWVVENPNAKSGQSGYLKTQKLLNMQ